MDSDVSELGLTNSLIPPPNDQTSGGGGPVVRTTNPATAGVIPIALGNGDSSAASNPTPELVGRPNNKFIVGTQFNVLTYTPPGGSDPAATIKKRFETEVIKCSCQYGAGGTNLPAIYRTAQWPAIWNGDSYELFKPSTAANAPGQALSSGENPTYKATDLDSPNAQSLQCQECCRDHHDTSATGVAKFDPERSDGLVTKFNPNGSGTLVELPNTSSGGIYVDACRVIRVDGFWRVASDMYSRQFGLLETETVSGAKAKTGVPTKAPQSPNATDAYTSFVKNYLKQYDGTVGTAPTNAQSLFDGTTGINVPLLVTIANPVSITPGDYRYLHGRGLYVDYLEAKARAKLVSVLADTSAGGRCDQTTTPAKALEDCVLPYLPFTSVNLTEIAKWVASDPTVLNVNSGGLLATNPLQPSGSRTLGTKVGTSGNAATVRNSNSGAAVNTLFTTLKGVDPTDETSVGTDNQPFEVGGSSPSGGEFHVRLEGLSGQSVKVFYAIGSDTGECFVNASLGGDYRCSTSSTLPAGGSIRVENYQRSLTAFSRSITCEGQPKTALGPALENWQVVSQVQICLRNNGSCTDTAVPNNPIPDDTISGGVISETTTISIPAIPTAPAVPAPSDSLIKVRFASQSTRFDTVVATCTLKGNGDINKLTWQTPYPWE
jgi:hypothetical protein